MKKRSSFLKAAGIAAGVILLGQGCGGTGAPSPSVPIQPEAQEDVREAGPVVEYVEGGFSPNELQVVPGTKVKFVNKTSQPVWVASDPHPTHTNLQGFDSLKAFGRGEAYEYTFTDAGKWDFHNHVSPGAKGRIIVK
ncbi:MAG TPA: plastocyanin/azurin family copper-binding protein [Candidatus Methylomirabilis sp.]|nr:plastocyanin/azurin family copper-binding protein [Candidatus Methylomirabilis sp.]